MTTLPLPEFLLRRAINDYPIGLQGSHEPSATIVSLNHPIGWSTWQ